MDQFSVNGITCSDDGSAAVTTKCEIHGQPYTVSGCDTCTGQFVENFPDGPQQAAALLAAGWALQQDPNGGPSYWFNTQTLENSAEKPGGCAGHAADETGPGGVYPATPRSASDCGSFYTGAVVAGSVLDTVQCEWVEDSSGTELGACVSGAICTEVATDQGVCTPGAPYTGTQTCICPDNHMKVCISDGHAAERADTCNNWSCEPTIPDCAITEGSSGENRTAHAQIDVAGAMQSATLENTSCEEANAGTCVDDGCRNCYGSHPTETPDVVGARYVELSTVLNSAKRYMGRKCQFDPDPDGQCISSPTDDCLLPAGDNDYVTYDGG